jgi:hypothetical protein
MVVLPVALHRSARNSVGQFTPPGFQLREAHHVAPDFSSRKKGAIDYLPLRPLIVAERPFGGSDVGCSFPMRTPNFAAAIIATSQAPF